MSHPNTTEDYIREYQVIRDMYTLADRHLTYMLCTDEMSPSEVTANRARLNAYYEKTVERLYRECRENTGGDIHSGEYDSSPSVIPLIVNRGIL